MRGKIIQIQMDIHDNIVALTDEGEVWVFSSLRKVWINIKLPD